jgi:hypothetical protein
MRTETKSFDVKLPSPSDFLRKFPHYTAVQVAERPLFDLIMTAQNFVRAAVVTDVFGLPAVAAVADDVANAFQGRKDWDFVKQLSGAIVCALMEENEYDKSGNKRSVSRPGWSKGEVYNRRSAKS